jgi:enterobacterial common antigen flippase
MLTETQESLKKDQRRGSYDQILKSSSIIGGSSVITIILGIIRTKVLAVLLGPTGVGLIGIYTSITTSVGMLAGMGIANSGTRQIAEALGTGDGIKIARSITALRRLAAALAIPGALLLLVAAKPISRLTFGDVSHVGALAILSFTILLATIASGQSAVVQGMRRIGDLAKINILGTFWGTALCIPIVYFFREDGIVPLLLTLSLITTLTSWWYARRIEVLKVKMNWIDLKNEARAFLGLGLAFVVSGLMSTAGAYLIRVIIVRQLGIEAAGQYQAAWALSGVYVGFILGAMGADFYPRLTAVANDSVACNRLANEQAEVALLLAVPGIIATIVFAPVVISVFYSGKFGPAIDLIRWQMLGVVLKVAAWPIGFILLAKGDGKRFMLTEALTNLMSLLASWYCLSWFGLVGAGVAFFVMYAFCWLIVFAVVRRSYGFTWSKSNCRMAMLIFPCIGVAFLLPFWLTQLWATLSGGILALFVSILFVKFLLKLIDPSRLPIHLRTIVFWLGLLSPDPGR